MKIWKMVVAVGVLLVVVALTVLYFFSSHYTKEPIKVGILHSITGTMALSELPVLDATLFAIGQLNDKGGVLGRQIEPVIVDGRSDWPTFANGAAQLLNRDKVSVVFGCWTSASRKSVKPVFEKYHGLLFYPVQYEGMEQSPNIIYTGMAPNQQIIPAVKWGMDHFGKKAFLVGSDYVFPVAANAIIKDQLASFKGEVLGEYYIPLGSVNITPVIEKIKAAKPDFILSTINGDSNIFFFRALKEANIKIPVISFSIAEDDVKNIGAENIVGNYVAWSYFQTLSSPENKKFVHDFQKRFGEYRLTSDPMEAAYIGVNLWAQAVTAAGTTNVNEVIKQLKSQSFDAPEGVVSVDPETQHLWKMARIGKINSEGQFEEVWSSGSPIRPVPYPPSRSPADWDQFLQNMYERWNKHWANPNRGSESNKTK